MITVPNDYNQAASYTGEGGAKLAAGGYVCEIKAARVETVGQDAKQKFVLAVDIAEGEHKGFFDKAWKAAKAQDAGAKWRGTYEVFLLDRDGKTNPFFKGMITCIDKSNPGFQTVVNGQIDDAKLKGKKIGLLYREEEYLKDGKVRTAVKAFAARTVEDIRKGVETPQKKTLNGNAGAGRAPQAPAYAPANNGFTQVDDEELPF